MDSTLDKFYGEAFNQFCSIPYNIDEFMPGATGMSATVVIVAVSKNALSKFSELINKPIQVIGSFCR